MVIICEMSIYCRESFLFTPNSWYIEDQIKKDKTKKDKLNKLKNDLTDCAKKHSLPLDLRTKKMRERDKKVGNTFTSIYMSCN